MNKLYFLLMWGLCIIFFQSCQKSTPTPNSETTPNSTSTNVTISSGQTYVLNITGANNVSVYKQASHYQVSETLSGPTSSSFAYKYTPAANFTGEDEVMLVTITPVVTNGTRQDCQQVGNLVNTSVLPLSRSSYQTLHIKVTE